MFNQEAGRYTGKVRARDPRLCSGNRGLSLTSEGGLFAVGGGSPDIACRRLGSTGAGAARVRFFSAPIAFFRSGPSGAVPTGPLPTGPVGSGDLKAHR